MHAWMEIRNAARRLTSKPGFAFVAVLSLALGIGANLAIFSLVEGVVLAPLPYPGSDRLIMLTHSAPGAGIDEMGVSLGTFVHYRQLSETLEKLAVYAAAPLTVTGTGEAERVDGARVSSEFFPLLLAGAPLAGRMPDEADAGPDSEPVAVLSPDFARKRFGSEGAALGQRLEVNGKPVTIVGVVPAGFDFPSKDTQVWTALRFDAAALPLGRFSERGVARLRQGVTAADAQQELQSLIPRLQERFPGPSFDVIVEQSRLTVLVTGLKDFVVGDLDGTLWILLGTVGFVLLIACANVANLFLVDAEGRQREVSVRRALGAGSGRIAGYFLAEGMLLGLLGGGVGVLIAILGTTLLVRLAPVALPRLHEVGVDTPVLVFAGVISLASGVVLACLPALHERRVTVAASLAGWGRTSTATQGGRRSRDVLAAVQIAAALVVVVGAGLMARTFVHVLRLDPGFEAQGALTFDLSLPTTAYPDVESIVLFHQEALKRLGALPGVRVVGAVESLPLSGYSSVNPLARESVDLGSEETPPAVQLRGVMPGYFEAAGIPLLQGRAASTADLEHHTGATLVSEGLAERLAIDGDVLGQRVYPGSIPRDASSDEVPWYTVVGVVGDVRPNRLADAPQETAYFALTGSQGGAIMFGIRRLAYVVRSDVPPLTLADPVRAVIRQMDPNLPISDVRTLRDLVDRATAPTAFVALLLGVAALVAGTLGAVGVYGVLSYATLQRRTEMGIRMALGATRGDLSGLVLRHAVVLAGVGTGLGLSVAWVAARAMESMLVGIAPHDVGTFASASVVLFLLSMLAAWLPARRAAVQSPSEVLRA